MGEGQGKSVGLLGGSGWTSISSTTSGDSPP